MKKILSLLIGAALVSSFTLTAFALEGKVSGKMEGKMEAKVGAKKFHDIDDNQTFKKGIEFLSGKGIIGGYADGSYKPENTVNRAEMIKIIVEAYIKDLPDEQAALDALASVQCFEDVPADKWFNKYVCYAKSKAWIKGYNEGKAFHPDKTVSFVEALKISMKAFKLEFEEEKDVWFRQMVKFASKKNLIPFTVKAFHAGLKRDQMADLITRIIKEKSGELNEYLEDAADIIVSYDTIEKGQDLSKLILKVNCLQKGNCAKGPLFVNISAQNSSGESGVATITEVKGKVKVKLNLGGAPKDTPQPAHVHLSKCATIGDVKYSLTDLVNGRSETLLDTTLTDFKALAKTDGLSINVHKSAAEVTVYSACGDVIEI